MDGWIRIWFYETIDQANFRNNEHFLEIQPIYQYQIKENNKLDNTMLMCIRKQETDNPESTFWYAQVSSCYNSNQLKINNYTSTQVQ